MRNERYDILNDDGSLDLVKTLGYKVAHLDSVEKMLKFKAIFDRDAPKFASLDTETDGLNMNDSKAFLITFAYYSRLGSGKTIKRAVSIVPNVELMDILNDMCKDLKCLFGFNMTFDLAMLENAGCKYQHDNYSDVMLMARLGLDADHLLNGTNAKMSLKTLSNMFVHPKANESAKKITNEISNLNKTRWKILNAKLKPFKGWNVTKVKKAIGDLLVGRDGLPFQVEMVVDNWLEFYGYHGSYPKGLKTARYNDIDRDLLVKYACEDAILTLELAVRFMGVLKSKEQIDTFKRETETIKVFYDQARTGMRLDWRYIDSCVVPLQDYLKGLREELAIVLGVECTENQHKVIKKAFSDNWGIEVEGTGQTVLPKEVAYNKDNKDFCRSVELIGKLRQVAKWFSTYMNGMKDPFLFSMETGKIYPNLKQFGALTGRVSGVMQQMPSSALLDLEGNELFDPRKTIVPSGNGWNSIIYFDWSQIELRVQAHYTIKAFGGDVNLCRAYMPFKLKDKDGNEYNHLDEEDREKWSLVDANGDSIWLNEDGTPWTPTDLHGLNVITAFGEESKKWDNWKELRGAGKTTNFSCNYGGGLKSLITSAKLVAFSEEQIKAMFYAYKTNFPGVQKFKEMLEKEVREKGYVTNEFGRRYYLSDFRGAYKLPNYMVQGASADYLKRALKAVYDFLKEGGYKSRIIFNVHDEIQMELYDGEEHIIPKIKALVEKAPWCLCPVVMDVEITKTNWAEKEDWKHD